MRRVIIAISISVFCTNAWAADLVPFSPPWDDISPGPSSISGTLDKPAGSAGFVRVKDGHIYSGDKRLRLFGANFTAGADFPDHETADKVAARMAKFGLNAVRFHFLDSSWGTPRLIKYDSGDWKNWDTDTLDRLDYFIARLKEQGIYINLNLLVGRHFGVADGVDPSVNKLDWKAAHAVGFFHAPHIETQKAYARQLLTHRNPYTKLTYAEDPAVALVEINNENGLIHTWMSGDFDDLPDIFGKDLQRQWNEWLGKRYADTVALSKAWGARNEQLGPEILVNADFAQGTKAWNIEQHQGAAVKTGIENGIASIRVHKTGSADWHIQFNQPKIVIKKDCIYTVSFRAAADRERKVNLGVMQAHDPWANLGLYTTLTLTKELKPFTFTFIANMDDDNARFGFSDMNQAGAEFRFAGLSLKSGGRVGLGEEESLEKRNIRAPKVAEARTLPAGGRQDWIRFLWETERSHWTGMQKFLKEELGVKALIVGTIVATSTPNLMADLDVVDTHAYWEHPHFPGKPWDRNNWFVKNISMVDYLDHATVTRLAFQRVSGKPHMVSEYNHPAPNTHAGEGPLFIAAFAALQDWDAIFLYTYSHDDTKTKAGRIPDFFDIGQHPTIMANVPVASLLFRRGDVVAAKQVLTFPMTAESEIELIAKKGRAWGVLAVDQLGLDLKSSISHRVALDVTGKCGNPESQTLGKDSVTSDTGEITWSLPAKDSGLFAIRSPRTKGFIGHADGQTIELGDGVKVAVEKTRTGWCTLMMTLLEGETLASKPRRALLVATGYTENTGMGWKDDAKSTVGTNWGKPPSLVEPITATIYLPKDRRSVALYPLDECGQRSKSITTVAGGTESQLKISGNIWYEIEWK